MKQSEIKELSDAEFREKLDALSKNVADLKIAHSITPLEDPMHIRRVRRDVARIATEITKRQNQ